MSEAAAGTAETEEGLPRPKETIRRLVQGDLASLRVVIGLALIWAIFQFENDRFLSAQNLTNLMLQITAIGLISVGIVYVLLLGEVDLSVGAVSGRVAPPPGDRPADRGGAGDRRPPGQPLQPLRRALLRRHPGRLISLAGSPLTGARLDRLDQPHRSQEHRPRRHLLLP